MSNYYRAMNEDFGNNTESEEEQVSNCCGAQFGYPGWPDNDICSACGEHADIEEGE